MVKDWTEIRNAPTGSLIGIFTIEKERGERKKEKKGGKTKLVNRSDLTVLIFLYMCHIQQPIYLKIKF